MNKVVAHWMEQNLPERYWYELGPDGTAEQAFAALCKDALQAMPGNQRGGASWLSGPPTKEGWYWYKLDVEGGSAIHGPVHVLRPRMTDPTSPLCAQTQDTSIGQWKPVEQFRRIWAGPLPRPS